MWDSNSTKSIAGTETAVINIAQELSALGYQVVVSGDVKDSGVIRGVEYCNIEHLYDRHDYFDIIIGTSYIHFAIELKRKYNNYDKTCKMIFWAHNTDAHTWYQGHKIESKLVDEILEYGRTWGLHLRKWLDACVTLTSWHADAWSKTYKWPSDKQTIIGNGIDTSTFQDTEQRISNSFIWSYAISETSNLVSDSLFTCSILLAKFTASPITVIFLSSPSPTLPTIASP